MAPERPVRPLLSAPLELRVIFQDSGFRWLLRARDGVELWRGMVHLGTLSGDAIRHLVEHHLATAALQAAIERDLAARRPLARVERPLPDAVARAKLRQSRRGRGRAS